MPCHNTEMSCFCLPPLLTLRQNRGCSDIFKQSDSLQRRRDAFCPRQPPSVNCCKHLMNISQVCHASSVYYGQSQNEVELKIVAPQACFKALNMSKSFKLLISGGGITGPVVAFWLARVRTPSKPIHITIIEKASSTLKSGQGIEIQGPAREIAARMGLLDTIRSRTTGEQGFRCNDNDSRPYATFEQGGMTQELEIMRGDLCDVLTNAVKQQPNVELQYNRHITKSTSRKTESMSRSYRMMAIVTRRIMMQSSHRTESGPKHATSCSIPPTRKNVSSG